MELLERIRVEIGKETNNLQKHLIDDSNSKRNIRDVAGDSHMCRKIAEPIQTRSNESLVVPSRVVTQEFRCARHQRREPLVYVYV